MLEISSILLPVDFSERARGAARYIAPFAARLHAEVVLLHVLPPHYEFGSAELGTAILQDLIVQRRERARCAIDTFLEAEFSGVRTRRVLLEGDPARKIIDYAHQERCGLIFMPTQGHGPFRRLLLGSVTAKVLHDADCPVWTGVHMEGLPRRGPGVLRRVLCAVDLEQNSGKVLAWAARIANEFHASLTIVHAVSSLQPMTEGYQLSPEWRRFVLDQVEVDIAKLQQSAGTHADVSVMMGEVTEILCAEASRLEADLLVIGRASRAGILGRLTQHAYSIIRASPCPAVSV